MTLRKDRTCLYTCRGLVPLEVQVQCTNIGVATAWNDTKGKETKFEEVNERKKRDEFTTSEAITTSRERNVGQAESDSNQERAQ